MVTTVNPGFGHQHFIRATLAKIQGVRRIIQQVRPECALELDGGIDETTATLGVAAGANVLVAKTSIFGCSQAERHLRRLGKVTALEKAK
jgi:ribulose-phosphate 3-epimerase